MIQQSGQDSQHRHDKTPNGQSSGNLRKQQPETRSENASGELLPAAKTAAMSIGPMVMRLCSAKNRAQMTRYDVETWAAVLSVYPADVANLSLLEIALNADPFPDLGKVVARCQIKMAERSTQVTQADPAKLSKRVLLEIAKALQVDITGAGSSQNDRE